MKNVPDQLTQAIREIVCHEIANAPEAIREIVCHEIDVIVSEDNEWFTEQVDAAVKTYLFAAVAKTLKEEN